MRSCYQPLMCLFSFLSTFTCVLFSFHFFASAKGKKLLARTGCLHRGRATLFMPSYFSSFNAAFFLTFYVVLLFSFPCGPFLFSHLFKRTCSFFSTFYTALFFKFYAVLFLNFSYFHAVLFSQFSIHSTRSCFVYIMAERL